MYLLALVAFGFFSVAQPSPATNLDADLCPTHLKCDGGGGNDGSK